MSYQLPEPHGWIGANDHDPDAGVEGFTADQVLAAYLAGVEEAARMCEAVARDQLKDQPALQMLLTSSHGYQFASAIRALAADGLVERKG